jgi:hypothetical protein
VIPCFETWGLDQAKRYPGDITPYGDLLVHRLDGPKNKIWQLFGGGPNTGIFISKKGKIIARQGWPSRPS